MTRELAKEKIDFIGIGSIKSGTTWVAECFAEHPNILFSSQKSKKELHFFGSNKGNPFLGERYRSRFSRGIEWYLDQFPTPEAGKVRGEFCNSYLVDKHATERIKHYFPNIKILVVLRHPADMLYSLYWWRRGQVIREDMPEFSDYIEDEEFLDIGLYHKHLEKFYNVFASSQIYVTLLDDIKDDPKKVVRNLYTFLGVDSSFCPSIIGKKTNAAIHHRSLFIRDLLRKIMFCLKGINAEKIYFSLSESHFLYKFYQLINLTPHTYPEMKLSTRKELISYFRDDIEKLESLVDRDLSCWYGEKYIETFED